MQLSDFNYELPNDLIAQHPLANRTDSRLLELRPDEDKHVQLIDRQFREILDLVKPGDLLVFNDTKVIPARLHGKKETGGLVELLIERISGERQAWVQIRASKVPKIESIVHIYNQAGETFDIQMIGYDASMKSVFQKMCLRYLSALVNFLYHLTLSTKLTVKMRSAIKQSLPNILALLQHQPQDCILMNLFCSNYMILESIM
jgi:S-adenosylmethionine:tRNA-ribosyltransferase-isomerase (queuine synthetase)